MNKALKQCLAPFERAGMLQPNISRLEKSDDSMTVPTAKKLARALGLDDYKELLP
jgi:hypothetical protein